MMRERKSVVFKRHIAVDSQGLPQTISITTCSESDREGALSMIPQA